MIEESLVAYLLADASISALVSDRIHWGRIEAPALAPYVIMQKISAPRGYHMLGSDGLVESRIQVDCFAVTYLSAKSVARAIETRLSGFRGTQATTDFKAAFLQDERDTIIDDDAPADLMGVSLDFTIWHKEN